MPKKEELSQNKRQIILTEATRAFEMYGYKETKIIRIAEQCRVSTRTVYRLFESKEGLFLAYVRFIIATLFDELQETLPQHCDAQQRLRKLTELRFYYLKRGYKTVLDGLEDNPRFFRILYDVLEDELQELHRFICDCFREIDTEMEEEKIQHNAHAFNSYCDEYAIRLLKEGKQPEEYAEGVCNGFIFMLKGFA